MRHKPKTQEATARENAALRQEVSRLRAEARRSRELRDDEALRASRVQADRLAMMGTLAAGIAHEINNPLSYVLCDLQSLKDDLPMLDTALRRCRVKLQAQACTCSDSSAPALSEDLSFLDTGFFHDVVERVSHALLGALRIKEIAGAIAAFSLLERVVEGPVDVHAAIEHAITIAHHEVKYRARLVKDLGRIPVVLGSQGKLAHLFLNLILNAAHAIDEGDVEHNEIRIRTWADREKVFAEVSDTGRGIPVADRAQVFDPFHSVGGVRPGRGLGLSICKEIVEEMGGALTLDSDTGAGSKLVVELPVLPANWNAPCATDTGGAAAPRPQGRILVVDDEDGIRHMIARILGREHEIVDASSGRAAMERLDKDQRFDLLLVDLVMPQISGMELHAWLATRHPALAEQVVFLTGCVFTPRAREYLARVGNLRLEKSFDPTTFRRTVGELVLASKAKRGER